MFHFIFYNSNATERELIPALQAGSQTQAAEWIGALNNLKCLPVTDQTVRTHKDLREEFEAKRTHLSISDAKTWVGKLSVHEKLVQSYSHRVEVAQAWESPEFWGYYHERATASQQLALTRLHTQWQSFGGYGTLSLRRVLALLHELLPVIHDYIQTLATQLSNVSIHPRLTQKRYQRLQAYVQHLAQEAQRTQHQLCTILLAALQLAEDKRDITDFDWVQNTVFQLQALTQTLPESPYMPPHELAKQTLRYEEAEQAIAAMIQAVIRFGNLHQKREAEHYREKLSATKMQQDAKRLFVEKRYGNEWFFIPKTCLPWIPKKPSWLTWLWPDAFYGYCFPLRFADPFKRMKHFSELIFTIQVLSIHHVLTALPPITIAELEAAETQEEALLAFITHLKREKVTGFWRIFYSRKNRLVEATLQTLYPLLAQLRDKKLKLLIHYAEQLKTLIDVPELETDEITLHRALLEQTMYRLMDSLQRHSEFIPLSATQQQDLAACQHNMGIYFSDVALLHQSEAHRVEGHPLLPHLFPSPLPRAPMPLPTPMPAPPPAPILVRAPNVEEILPPATENPEAILATLTEAETHYFRAIQSSDPEERTTAKYLKLQWCIHYLECCQEAGSVAHLQEQARVLQALEYFLIASEAHLEVKHISHLVQQIAQLRKQADSPTQFQRLQRRCNQHRKAIIYSEAPATVGTSFARLFQAVASISEKQAAAALPPSATLTT